MMMATRLVLSRRTLLHNNQRRQWCRRCSVSCHSANNNAPSLLLDTRRSSRISLTRFSHTNSNSNKPRSSSNRSTKNSFFLTPGFQPTSITGDNIGFYQGSTFYDGAPPNVLPTLNASPILSPGKYVRQSSWSSSSRHLNRKKNNNGAKSGTAAALRLVDARREFMSLMKRELLGSQRHNTNDGSDKEGIIEDVRKLYDLEGHGVPTELLSYLIQMVRGWTAPPPQPLVAQSQNASPVVQFTFQNIPNSTLLNRDQIQLIHANGYTTKLTENGNHHHMLNHGGGDWEHDFDLYMVVMDRIASRLASFALLHPPRHSHNYGSDTSTAIDDGGDDNNNEAALGSSGSVITPASLQHWNVTMMEGEALPLTLLPIRKREPQSSSIVLTVEWVLNNKRGRNDCCNVVLRLQDDGLAAGDFDDGGREPISLVFDGVYV